jgi:hypothetical protein
MTHSVNTLSNNSKQGVKKGEEEEKNKKYNIERTLRMGPIN